MSKSADSMETLTVCLHLVRACEMRRQLVERDKLLVLAGVAAAQAGLNPIAAYCRRMLLASNPGHLIRQYTSFSVAVADARFETYLRQVRRNFPREKLELMLESLGVQRGNERATYADDYEYAAGLLGLAPEALEASLREEPQRPTGPPLLERRTNWRTASVLLVALLAILGCLLWQFARR